MFLAVGRLGNRIAFTLLLPPVMLIDEKSKCTARRRVFNAGGLRIKEFRPPHLNYFFTCVSFDTMKLVAGELI